MVAHLYGKGPLGEVLLALLGLLELPRGVLGGETAADGAGLLRSQVQRQILLVLVEEAQLSPLLRVDDGQDARDRLAEIVAVSGERRSMSALLRCSKTLLRQKARPERREKRTRTFC